ncbi:unnamed protein product, partial [Effrenium voratum]
AFDLLSQLQRKLPEADGQRLVSAMKRIQDPIECCRSFLETAKGHQGDDAPLGEDDVGEEEAAAAPETSALETLKSTFNKATGGLLDLMFDLMSGKHLDACRELSREPGKISKLVQQTAQQSEELDSMQLSKDTKAFLQCLVVVVQSFDHSAKSVSLTASLPAPSLISFLATTETSDQDAADARGRVWKLVQGERKKLVGFSTPKSYSKDALMAAFRACGKVFNHSGQLNSSHRLTCASADLLVESVEDPWLSASVPSKDMWSGNTQFATSLNGPTDFALLFDGRMRDIRRIKAHTEELCLIYSGGCPARAGRMRRLPFAAKKVEMGVLRFPCARNKVKTSKKEAFTSCGEATNFQGTFSGVAYRPTSELPLVSGEEKKKILPAAPAVQAAPDSWRDVHGDDVPLFWQESKPIALFAAVLDELTIKAVVDVTAGTGALMEACLTRGVQYHGCCLNKDHMAWLQAIADRAACGLISVQGSSLYSDVNLLAFFTCLYVSISRAWLCLSRAEKHMGQMSPVEWLNETLRTAGTAGPAAHTPLGPPVRASAVTEGLAPKARRPFALFLKEKSQALKGSTRDDCAAEMKKLGAEWKRLSDAEKNVYKAMCQQEFMSQRSAMKAAGLPMRREEADVHPQPATAPAVPAAPQEKLQNSEQRLRRSHLGEGSYGAVLLGQAKDGRQCAVKVFKSRDAVEDLQREARVLKHLQGALQPSERNFFPCLYAAEESRNPFPFLALELGGQGPLQQEVLVPLSLQLKAAVKALHSCRLMHLDLKPSNILWSKDCCQLKIADFGMAEYMGRENGNGAKLGRRSAAAASPIGMDPKPPACGKLDYGELEN